MSAWPHEHHHHALPLAFRLMIWGTVLGEAICLYLCGYVSRDVAAAYLIVSGWLREGVTEKLRRHDHR